MSIRVLLADDHVVLRSGLAMLMYAQPDLDVVGESPVVARAAGLGGRRA